MARGSKRKNDDDDFMGGYGNRSSRRSSRSSRSKVQQGLIGSIVGFVMMVAPTAGPWLIAAVLFWISTVLTSLVNMIILTGTFQLKWYTMLFGIPFYMLLVPGLVLLISYEEGRSRLAIRRPELANNFNSVELFIPNNVIMTVVMIVVLIFAGIATVSQSSGFTISDLINGLMWYGISVLSPLFTYAGARFAASSIK